MHGSAAAAQMNHCPQVHNQVLAIGEHCLTHCESSGTGPLSYTNAIATIRHHFKGITWSFHTSFCLLTPDGASVKGNGSPRQNVTFTEEDKT